MRRLTSIPMLSVDRLVALAEAGAAGRSWYGDARTQLDAVAVHFNESPYFVKGIAAILSPRTSVRRSMRLLGMQLRGWVLPPDVYSQKRKALDAWSTWGRLTGQKVNAFYNNLIGDEDAVVLDTWMAKAMMPGYAVDWPARGGPLVAKATDRIRDAARRLAWTPAATQAAIWCKTYSDNRGGAAPPKLEAKDALEIPDGRTDDS